MRKISWSFLFIFICLTFSGCQNVEETHESINTPTAMLHEDDAKETSKEPEVLNELVEPKGTENLNEFELLEVNNDNTIIIDSSILMLLSKNTKSYKIENKQFSRKNHKGKLNVEYPQFIGNDKNLQNINSLIYDLVDSNVLKEDEINNVIDSDLKYEIEKSSDDIISILFYGSNNARLAAHPENIVFTVNYDLKTKKMIELNQVTNIDVDFLKKSKGALEKQVEKELCDGILATNGDLDTLTDRLKAECAVFYFKDDKIYVGFMINGAGFYTAYASFLYK